MASQLQRQSKQVEKVVAGGTEQLSALLSRRVGSRAGDGSKDLFELPALPNKKEEEVSSSEEEGEGSMLLETLGMGDVQDVYQVLLRSSFF